MAGPFETYEDDSFWRSIAMAMWRHPRDPQIYASLDIDAEPLLRVREAVEDQTGIRLTPTHFVGKALAEGIQEFPEVNGILVRGKLHHRETVDVWFNVAFDDDDLFGTKISDVENRSILEIEEELTHDAEQIRADEDERLHNYSRIASAVPDVLLKPLLWLLDVCIYRLKIPLTWLGIGRDPFGTAMVTNIGTFDLKHAFAPLVPLMRMPALIVVGRLHDKPVAEDGEVAVKPILPLSVTVDHRYLDGFQGAKMAHAFRAFLEDEARLWEAIGDVEPPEDRDVSPTSDAA